MPNTDREGGGEGKGREEGRQGGRRDGREEVVLRSSHCAATRTALNYLHSGFYVKEQ